MLLGAGARARATAPARNANLARNLLATGQRAERWRPARDALWALLDPLLCAGAEVAVVGAGHTHDLPLTRLASRAGRVALIDLDRRAARGAVRLEPRDLRSRLAVLQHDVTDGAADRIAAASARGLVREATMPDGLPLPGAPYDLVVGDLFYSQLLYPALLDLGIGEAKRRRVLEQHGPALTRAVVARLHASTPGGHVVHVHDALGWWAEHEQPFEMAAVIAALRCDPRAGRTMMLAGSGPWESEPRRAVEDLGLHITQCAWWRWPFDDATDYLVDATVAHSGGSFPCGRCPGPRLSTTEAAQSCPRI